MAHRVVGNDRLLTDLPHIADIAEDSSPEIVIRKAAQTGVSELLINLALWATATGYAGRGVVLYCMPTQRMMDDFTQARIDPAIQASPMIREILQPEPTRKISRIIGLA